MPTASCPRVRLSRGPIAPLTVCTSEVQIRALVVLTMASVGPGVGIGFSANPTLPIPFITKARIVVDLQYAVSGTQYVGAARLVPAACRRCYFVMEAARDARRAIVTMYSKAARSCRRR